MDPGPLRADILRDSRTYSGGPGSGVFLARLLVVLAEGAPSAPLCECRDTHAVGIASRPNPLACWRQRVRE